MPTNIVPSLAAGVVPTPQLYIPKGFLEVDPAAIIGLFLVTCIRYDPVLLEDHDWHSTKSNGETRSPYLILPFHLSRLRTAAESFQWTAAIELLSRPNSLEWLEEQCEDALRAFGVPHWSMGEKNAYKLRCLLGPSGDLEIRVKPASGRPFDLLGAPYMTPAYLHPLTPTTLMTWPTAYAPLLNVFLDVAPTEYSGKDNFKNTNRDLYTAARNRMGFDSTTPVDEVLLYNTHGEVTEGSLRTISVWREGSWVTPALSSGCMDGSVRRWMLSTGKVREAHLMKSDLRPGEWVLTSNGIEGCCFGKFVSMDRDAFNSTVRGSGYGQDVIPGHSTIDYPR